MTGVPSPVVSMGNRAIDMTPRFLKEFAVRQFGENDKPMLIGGITITVLGVAATAGWIGIRRPRTAYGVFVGAGPAGARRRGPDRTATAPRALTVVPALVTFGVSLGALVVLLRAVELAPKAGDAVSGRTSIAALSSGRFSERAPGSPSAASSRSTSGQNSAAESRRSVALPRAAEPPLRCPPAAPVPTSRASPATSPRTATSTASTRR